jgi:hypothetical protein
VVEHTAWMKKRQREQLSNKTPQASAPGKAPWPVVIPRKRTAA